MKQISGSPPEKSLLTDRSEKQKSSAKDVLSNIITTLKKNWFLLVLGVILVTNFSCIILFCLDVCLCLHVLEGRRGVS